MSVGIYPVPFSGIQESLVDAKGDILTASADNVPARLAIGANGTVLTAASGEATGLSWATPASSGGMTLLSTTTPNTGSSYTVSSISQDYVNLLLVWNMSCTVAKLVTLAFAGGGSSGGGVKEDGVVTSFTAGNASLMPDTQAAGNVITCLITNYTAAAEKTLQIAFGGVNTGWRGGGYQGFNSYTSAISTFTVAIISGSFTGGSLKVYGVK